MSTTHTHETPDFLNLTDAELDAECARLRREAQRAIDASRFAGPADWAAQAAESNRLVRLFLLADEERRDRRAITRETEPTPDHDDGRVWLAMLLISAGLAGALLWAV